MMYVTYLFLAANIGFYGHAMIVELKYSIGIPEPLFDNSSRRLRTNTALQLPDNDGYELYSFDEIYDHFECKAYAADRSRPVPSLEQWLFMRNKYREVVDGTVSFDDTVPPTLGYPFGNTNVPPPFYAKQFLGKERSLYASRDIQEGEVVHNSAAAETCLPTISTVITQEHGL